MGKLYFISPHCVKRQTARFNGMVQSLENGATSLAILEGTGAGFISCCEALLRLYQKHEQPKKVIYNETGFLQVKPTANCHSGSSTTHGKTIKALS